MKQKALTITLLVLLSTAFLFTANLTVQGQSLEGVTISQVTSGGSLIALANAEMPATLRGTITTYNGGYRIYYNETMVATGFADGYNVVSNFTFPEFPSGDYLLTLVDTSTSVNATELFPIVISYGIKPVLPTSPAQLQEGSGVPLNVTVLGGNANREYILEVLVAPPAAVGTNYTRIVTFTTSSLGTAISIVIFPGTFSPSNASTAYIGTYNVYLNQSRSLAESSFVVGFIDATQYHRQDTVKINAPGYQPSQVATVAIKFGETVVFSQQVSATSQGVVTATWTVPSNASIGTYTAAITPLTTPSKIIADVQTFTIRGYSVDFRAANLANEPVPQLSLEALDKSTGQTISGTTGTNGVATIGLERGDHTVTAYWNQVKVGETQVSITGTNTYTVACRLTNLQIKVQDTNGIVIPFVNLNFTYQYTSRTGQTVTGTSAGQTDNSGVYTLSSTLTGIGYTVAASKYNTIFNSITISNLPAQPSSQNTIICPDKTLTVRTVDYNRAVLPNARITLVEQASGIFYSVTTDGNGYAQIQVTFGQYRAETYTSANILLNDTVLNVLSDSDNLIRCVLYNLPVSVKVVDYFGNGIGNINVQLSRPGMNTLSATTLGDGTVSFSNVIGGGMEITAYPSGNTNAYVASNLQVDSAATVQLRIDRFVSLGGVLVETSVLATLIIVVLAVLLAIVVEVYRKTGFKLRRKAES